MCTKRERTKIQLFHFSASFKFFVVYILFFAQNEINFFFSQFIDFRNNKKSLNLCTICDDTEFYYLSQSTV